jgi:hypothetical protein
MQKYHFELTHWNKQTELKTIEANTYAEAIAQAYRNDSIVGTNCKGITLLSGVVICNPHTPGEYDINLF